SEVQIILNAKIQEGSYIEIMDFPYPKSLFKNGKWFGEIKITLGYNPPLDSDYGQEYCRTNIDLSLGTYSVDEETGEVKYSGEVPLEKKWYDKYEKHQVENGFKWNPIKAYHRKISRGISGDGWKLRLDCVGRLGVNYVEQDVLIVINIKDPDGGDIYSEIINELTEKAFVHQELIVNNSIRLRN
ncbi:MAG: hypothetical protein PHN55_16210, partial [Dysgonamonadaceae bacterium]|nr:hypothetical protein [Dysgonamonadaceae bacterium]